MAKQEVYVPNMKPVARERANELVRNMPYFKLSYEEWRQVEGMIVEALQKWAQNDYTAGAIAEIE